MAYPLQKLGWGLPVDYYPVHAHKYRCTSYVYIIIYNVYIYMCTWVFILYIYIKYILSIYTYNYIHMITCIRIIRTDGENCEPTIDFHPSSVQMIDIRWYQCPPSARFPCSRESRSSWCPSAVVSSWPSLLAPSACLGNLDSVKYHISCKGHPYQGRLEHLPGVCENDFTPTFWRVFPLFRCHHFLVDDGSNQGESKHKIGLLVLYN